MFGHSTSQNKPPKSHNHTRNETRATLEDLRIIGLKIIATHIHTVFRTISNSACSVLFLVSIMTGIASRTFLNSVRNKVERTKGYWTEKRLETRGGGGRNRSSACFYVPFPIFSFVDQSPSIRRSSPARGGGEERKKTVPFKCRISKAFFFFPFPLIKDSLVSLQSGPKRTKDDNGPWGRACRACD